MNCTLKQIEKWLPHRRQDSGYNGLESVFLFMLAFSYIFTSDYVITPHEIKP